MFPAGNFAAKITGLPYSNMTKNDMIRKGEGQAAGGDE